MTQWAWAASGILAALFTLAALVAIFDADGDGACIAAPAFVAGLYLTFWIWSHVV